MQLTHLASSLNFPCAFSMALYQTKKSLQIISEYLPHPIFTLMLESERFSKLCCPQRLFSSFFSLFFWSFLGAQWFALARSTFKRNWEFKSFETFVKSHPFLSTTWCSYSLCYFSFWVFPTDNQSPTSCICFCFSNSSLLLFYRCYDHVPCKEQFRLVAKIYCVLNFVQGTF